MKPIQKAKSTQVLPEHRTPVKIKNKILKKEECRGFLVNEKHLTCRRPGENGKYIGWVPGAGGDVWWVEHNDNTIGAYLNTELTDVK